MHTITGSPVTSDTPSVAPRLARRQAGLARAAAHNHELHVLAEIRRHGGYQNALPLDHADA